MQRLWGDCRSPRSLSCITYETIMPSLCILSFALTIKIASPANTTRRLGNCIQNNPVYRYRTAVVGLAGETLAIFDWAQLQTVPQLRSYKQRSQCYLDPNNYLDFDQGLYEKPIILDSCTTVKQQIRNCGVIVLNVQTKVFKRRKKRDNDTFQLLSEASTYIIMK